MVFWDIFGYLAWIVSFAIFAWMLFDVVRVGREYDEDLLLSSREGSDELVDELIREERRHG